MTEVSCRVASFSLTRVFRPLARPFPRAETLKHVPCVCVRPPARARQFVCACVSVSACMCVCVCVRAGVCAHATGTVEATSWAVRAWSALWSSRSNCPCSKAAVSSKPGAGCSPSSPWVGATSLRTPITTFSFEAMKQDLQLGSRQMTRCHAKFVCTHAPGIKGHGCVCACARCRARMQMCVRRARACACARL
jgi:hypothetical protein